MKGYKAMIRNNGRIVSYLMNSDWKTPVTVIYNDIQWEVTPRIYKNRVGVVSGNQFIPASSLTAIVKA